MNKKLIDAVNDQLGGDEEENKQTMKDVCAHGADAGFPGFIYYSDTVKFFDENKDAILEEVKEMASSLGEDALQMIAGFVCLKDAKFSTTEIAEAVYGNLKGDDAVSIKNALAWFALEEVSRFVCES